MQKFAKGTLVVVHSLTGANNMGKSGSSSMLYNGYVFEVGKVQYYDPKGELEAGMYYNTGLIEDGFDTYTAETRLKPWNDPEGAFEFEEGIEVFTPKMETV